MGSVDIGDEPLVRLDLVLERLDLFFGLRLREGPGAVLLHERHQGGLRRAQHGLLGGLERAVRGLGSSLGLLGIEQVLREGALHLLQQGHDLLRARLVLGLERGLPIQLLPVPRGHVAGELALEKPSVGLAEHAAAQGQHLLQALPHAKQPSRGGPADKHCAGSGGLQGRNGAVERRNGLLHLRLGCHEVLVLLRPQARRG
mmetsp:Transcript_106815/g.284187  ORF Transcript_106815/g.284187 Transcript_106815/m.284187 type:complete len:201 (+) Transcript_106815:1372-1974(+)